MKLFIGVLSICLVVAFAAAQSADPAEPSAEYLPPVGEAEAGQLSDDGYRYKTVRRLKLRHRRELSNEEYLPPVDESPSQEYMPPVEGAPLADDNYRYKSVRKSKFRHRRDVSEIAEPSNEYLPPVEVELAPELKTVLGDDGYRYKTVRRLKLRHRREVPNQEYLPPVDNSPSQEYLPPVDAAAIGDTKVAEDGYRYKTVRKLKFRARHRRDVSEIAEPSNEYLPPVEVELAPELKTVLGDDGYRYKTVRRLKLRRHRREAEAVAADEAAATNGEYLPPVEAPAAESAVAEVKAAEPEGTELAKDGYRYKTVRRIRYRYRH